MNTKVVVRYGQEIDLSYERKGACVRCQREGRDRSCNNMHFYGLDENGKHKGGHCFSCGYTIASEEHMEKSGFVYEYDEEFDNMGSLFNNEIHDQIKSETGVDTKGYRGIRTDISKWFGVRYQYSEEDGSVMKSLYPCTKNYEISGYKVRNHPKDFRGAIGEVGAECDLFMQFRFKTHSGICVITAGEVDALSAYGLLKTQHKDKKYDEIAVVSPTIGETGAAKQVQKHYSFFNQFKKCIVMFDQDPAGIKAAQEVCKVLPKGKAYIATLRKKDVNEYIWDKERNTAVDFTSEFISDFWAAKPYTPAGVHASTTLYEQALERLDLDMISLPPFMKTAANMLGSGLVLREITLCLAKTSIGKTTLVSGLCRHWALNEPKHVLGVLSLEADAGKFSQNMLSYHLQVPLHRMDASQRREYLNQPHIMEKVKQLYERPDGTPTMYVCDDRGATWEQVKEKILEMIISMGITILCVDPYSDLLSSMTVSEQEEVATWFKKIMKEYGVTPIIISHVRKGANGADAGPLTEDDAQGSSFLVKAAGQTIALERDKQAEDPMERNRTKITILKNRDFSETGPAGSMYYDIATANLYDYDEWVASHPEMLKPKVDF